MYVYMHVYVYMYMCAYVYACVCVHVDIYKLRQCPYALTVVNGGAKSPATLPEPPHPFLDKEPEEL